jgi:hypothetical protein
MSLFGIGEIKLHVVFDPLRHFRRQHFELFFLAHDGLLIASNTLLGQVLLETFFEEVESIVPKENIVADDKGR